VCLQSEWQEDAEEAEVKSGSPLKWKMKETDLSQDAFQGRYEKRRTADPRGESMLGRARGDTMERSRYPQDEEEEVLSDNEKPSPSDSIKLLSKREAIWIEFGPLSDRVSKLDRDPLSVRMGREWVRDDAL
jgi:hypothetical protein